MLDQYFTEEFLRSLPADTDDAVLAMHKEWNRFSKMKSGAYFDEWVKGEVMIMVRQFLAARGITVPDRLRDMDIETVDLDYVGSVLQAEAEKAEAANARKAQRKFADSHAAKYRDLFTAEAVYEFTDEEHARIEALLAEIKAEISAAEAIPTRHRERLLKRLQATGQELHKRTSEIDRFYGFLGEAGIASRKFPADAKAITARVSELAEIVMRAVARAENIKTIPFVNSLLAER